MSFRLENKGLASFFIGFIQVSQNFLIRGSPISLYPLFECELLVLSVERGEGSVAYFIMPSKHSNNLYILIVMSPQEIYSIWSVAVSGIKNPQTNQCLIVIFGRNGTFLDPFPQVFSNLDICRQAFILPVLFVFGLSFPLPWPSLFYSIIYSIQLYPSSDKRVLRLYCLFALKRVNEVIYI